MEVQRYANIVPNGVQHVSHLDLSVNGEMIPAHTLIQPLFVNLLKVLLTSIIKRIFKEILECFVMYHFVKLFEIIKCIFGKCRTFFCISNSIKLFLSDARETTGVMVKPLDLRDFWTSRGMLEEMITSFPSQLERGNVLEKHWPRLK